MTSIDELFRSATGSKRKLAPTKDPNEIYKAVKTSATTDSSGARHNTHAQEQADDEPDNSDEDAGPVLPDDEQFEDDEEGRFFGGGVNAEQANALDYVEQQEGDGNARPEELNLAWVRRTAQTFEKRITRNAELRSKFQDEPAKFMESEAELDADIKALSLVTEQPSLYQELVKTGTVERLVTLLTHENTDIAIEAISILAELIDDDVEAEQDQWNAVVDAMLEADLTSLLLQSLERLDEAVEADSSGVYHTLNLVENIASSNSASERLVKDAPLLPWLLQRIQKPEPRVGQNKQYAAEVLAILLQSSTANRAAAIALNAVDVLLQLLSAFRKRDPRTDSEEEEYAENLFDSLACIVDSEQGKEELLNAEGLELCIIMLREGKFSKPRALRILDHALGGPANSHICEHFVTQAGLKPLFALFMKSRDQNTREHALGIFAALLRHLPGDSAPRIRLLAKFLEKDYEKTTQIITVRQNYLARLRPVEEAIKAERLQLPPAERDAHEADWLSQRLDAGFFALQVIDVILAWLVAEDAGAKSHIVAQLAVHHDSLQTIRGTLEEQLRDVQGATSAESAAAADMLNTLLEFVR